MIGNKTMFAWSLKQVGPANIKTSNFRNDSILYIVISPLRKKWCNASAGRYQRDNHTNNNILEISEKCMGKKKSDESCNSGFYLEGELLKGNDSKNRWARKRGTERGQCKWPGRGESTCKTTEVGRSFISEKQREELSTVRVKQPCPGRMAGRQDLLHAGLHIIRRIWDLGPSTMGC